MHLGRGPAHVRGHLLDLAGRVGDGDLVRHVELHRIGRRDDPGEVEGRRAIGVSDAGGLQPAQDARAVVRQQLLGELGRRPRVLHRPGQHRSDRPGRRRQLHGVGDDVARRGTLEQVFVVAHHPARLVHHADALWAHRGGVVGEQITQTADVGEHVEEVFSRDRLALDHGRGADSPATSSPDLATTLLDRVGELVRE